MGEGKEGNETPLLCELNGPCTEMILNRSVLAFCKHLCALSQIRAKPPFRMFSSLSTVYTVNVRFPLQDTLHLTVASDALHGVLTLR